MAKSHYVNRWNVDGSMQPFDVNGAKMFGFLFQADGALLQAYVDTHLNQPGGTDYEPVLPWLMVSFASMQHVTARLPPFRDFGINREAELTIWIPVRRRGTLEVALYAPYMLVDNPMAVEHGREIFGLPKEFAQFPQWHESLFEVKAYAFTTWSPETVGAIQTILRLRRTGSAADAAEGPIERLGDLLAEALGEIDADVLGVLTNMLIPPRGTMVAVKQMPEASDTRDACYQECVAGKMTIRNVERVRFLSRDYELEIPGHDSHPFQREFGLATKPDVAFCVEFDFSLEADASAEHDDAPAAVAGAVPKRKIAVLGGGVGAMAAAYALTEGPNRDRYEVTVYQMGWRLGGKGASGRNRDACQRIEEHGLHIWFGFYYNAIPLMQRCYEELTGNPEAWLRAFQPHHYIVLQEKVGNRWLSIEMPFPPRDGPVFGPAAYMREIVRWMRIVLTERSWGDLISLGGLALSPFAALAPMVDRLVDAFTDEDDLSEAGEMLVAWLIEPLGVALRTIRLLAFHGGNPLWRRIWILLDLAVATIRGMIRDDVRRRGYDQLDGLDLRQWLAKHGADRASCDSAWVNALYSLAFAFVDGDVSRPAMGAGTALRCTLRMIFGYHDAMMWKMQAGMGDAVFAPLYEVLRRRGVRFEFFHRVRALHPNKAGTAIERIEIGRQLRLREGQSTYEPLIHCNGWAAWPSDPDYTQLDPKQVAQLRKLSARKGAHVNLESVWSSWGPDQEETVVLRAGKHFDDVVLGISVGALPVICEKLIKVNPDWQRMVAALKTVRTQGFQLWLDKPLATFWSMPSPILGTYEQPIDTWADMSHLIRAECWPADTVHSIAYFCGVMPETGATPPWFSDPQFPLVQREAAFTETTRFIDQFICPLWSALPPNPNGFDLSRLYNAVKQPPKKALRGQFWIANVEPSERYVLSVPGSLEHRLPKPGAPGSGTGFANLFVAGDWTRNGINAGCVEAAVMSGLMASRAISGLPREIIAEHDTE